MQLNKGRTTKRPSRKASSLCSCLADLLCMCADVSRTTTMAALCLRVRCSAHPARLIQEECNTVQCTKRTPSTTTLAAAFLVGAGGLVGVQ